MNWFKHSTSSHDDPDIADARDRFGDFGYSGFFILLEVYGQEFNKIDADGYLTLSKTFVARKLHKRWTKVALLLNFFSKEILEPRFHWREDGEYMSLKVPKYIDIASNWVGRQKKPPLQSPSVAPTAIEVEVEEEEENTPKGVEKNHSLLALTKDLPEIKPTAPDGKEPHGDFIRITSIEHDALKTTYGEDRTKRAINGLDNHLGATGKQYRSHYHRLKTWIEQDMRDGRTNPPTLPKNAPKAEPPAPPGPDYQAYREMRLAMNKRDNDAFRRDVIDPLKKDKGTHAWAAFIEPLVVVSNSPESATVFMLPDSIDWVRDHYLAAITEKAGKEIILTSEVD